jgi:hypothetical protein
VTFGSLPALLNQHESIGAWNSHPFSILLGKQIVTPVLARTSGFEAVAMIETRRVRPSSKR